MAEIKDKVLFSRELSVEDTFPKKPFIYWLINKIQEELKDTGDRDWLLDCTGEASIRLSHIEGVAIRVASGFARLGFKAGDIVHTAYNSCLDFYWPVFGAWLAGGLVSVADPNLSVELIKSQLLDTNAKIVVCSSEAAPKYVAANKMLPDTKKVAHIFVLDKEPWQSKEEGCSSFRSLFNDDGSLCPKTVPTKFSLQQPAVIHWSSGTSGSPKGIVQSQQYLYRMMKKSKLPPKTISLSSNIMFHGGAFLLPFDGGIFNRFTCCFIKEDAFSGPTLLQTIDKYKPMFYMCGTNHFNILAVQNSSKPLDLSSLKVVMPAGGSITSTSAINVKSILPGLSMIFQFYGSTEVGGISMSFDDACLGNLLPGVSVYIRDRETGLKLGPNLPGEIMAKTSVMMLEYLNKKEETKVLYDDDGYVHMGDIGYFDEDGKLYYHSRDKELLKVNNHWFGPGEVESLLEQIPVVKDAIVWGTYNKASGNDTVHAGVVVETISMDGNVVTREDLKLHVSNNLQSEKQITGDVHFIEEIPYSPQGKKLRNVMKQKYS